MTLQRTLCLFFPALCLRKGERERVWTLFSLNLLFSSPFPVLDADPYGESSHPHC